MTREEALARALEVAELACRISDESSDRCVEAARNYSLWASRLKAAELQRSVDLASARSAITRLADAKAELSDK